ncbi:hypothetical protein JOB18_021077 [Solea senegalensis]|uniref:Uncharacterized protein n=1 Tax=Solea senegalensis TaxID=28829 RepID=A0AAV6QAS1_SOLSE|nr:hypothetical protein JOB18_021077 [Solea senegalensis]
MLHPRPLNSNKESKDSERQVVKKAIKRDILLFANVHVENVVALTIFTFHTGKDHNTVSAASSCLKEDTLHIATSSLLATMEADTDGLDRNKGNCYSNVGVFSAPQSQPDGLLYATVSFNKYTDCSTDTPPPAEVTYCTIKRADGSAVAACC